MLFGKPVFPPNLSSSYWISPLWLYPNTQYSLRVILRDRGRWKEGAGDLGWAAALPLLGQRTLDLLLHHDGPQFVSSAKAMLSQWRLQSFPVPRVFDTLWRNPQRLKEAQVVLHYSGHKQETVCYTHIVVSEESFIKGPFTKVWAGRRATARNTVAFRG